MPKSRTLRRNLLPLIIAVAFAFGIRHANAAPGESGSGSFSTRDGARGSSRGSGRGSGWKAPERVIAGNAVSFMAPFQIGAVGYLPKAKFAFQYDRQLYRAHWLYVGAALLADHGRWKNFRMDDCGFTAPAVQGRCGKGGVIGFDITAGWAHKWYLKKRPYLVPMARVGFGYSFWKYPDLSGSRQQDRMRSHAVTLRIGGGFRFFVLDNLAIGGDINIPVGFLVHIDKALGGSKDRKGGFLLGFELLPAAIEYRF